MARACRLTGDPDAWLFHLRIAQYLGWSLHDIQLERRLGEAQSKNIWKVEEELRRDVLEVSPGEKLLTIEALINGYLENDRPSDAYHLALAWTLEYPDDWLGWLSLGRACQLNLSWQKAISNYEKTLELKPDQGQARLWLGETLVSDTQHDRAMTQFRAYLQDHPGDPSALVGLARCQFSQGLVDEARATLDELLSLHKESAAALFTRAQLEQAEAPEKALPWLRKAVAIAPNEPNILHNLVLALRAAHREKEAEDFAQRLKERRAKATQLVELQMRILKDANNVELRFQLASLNLELGKEEEAAHWFQTVLWIDPDHRPTLSALADYWRKRGDSARAAYYSGLAKGTIPRMSPAGAERVN
jgi:tetratricopeptide (TPR) repeat protein